MQRFRTELSRIEQHAGRRTWVYAPYDQLTDRIGPLAHLEPGSAGLVLIESRWKAVRRPYHRQKLALVLANQRQFALEQARRGVAVHYVATREPYDVAVRQAAAQVGAPLLCMEPAERETRVLLEPLVEQGVLRSVPHAGWLTTDADFKAGAGDPPWRMDAFYRHVRRRTGVLMVAGKPAGGRFSHDGDNRQRWNGTPAAPEPPCFEPDPITMEVADWVEHAFADHPGRVDVARLPSTAADAEALWTWAMAQCMRWFGPYEDAMSQRSRTLFHTLVSPLVNLHRLLPGRLVADVLDLDIPINSKEGFVRQILGWREFVRHVHRQTDGFRRVPGVNWPTRSVPGRAGWSEPDPESDTGPPSTHARLDGGACPSVVEASEPLPPALWGRPSGLACLDTVVGDVLETGYSHHITRLMVIANLGTLLGWSPRDLTDWFWCAYIDAYDWVVEPNVLGMGTYAVGDLMTTKPYVSGAAYIAKMSDYCSGCAFHPKRTCPITHLYWHYLGRNRSALEGNLRLRLPLASARKRAPEKRAVDALVFAHVRDALAHGRRIDPAELAAAVAG